MWSLPWEGQQKMSWSTEESLELTVGWSVREGCQEDMLLCRHPDVGWELGKKKDTGKIAKIWLRFDHGHDEGSCAHLYT